MENKGLYKNECFVFGISSTLPGKQVLDRNGINTGKAIIQSSTRNFLTQADIGVSAKCVRRRKPDFLTHDFEELFKDYPDNQGREYSYWECTFEFPRPKVSATKESNHSKHSTFVGVPVCL